MKALFAALLAALAARAQEDLANRARGESPPPAADWGTAAWTTPPRREEPEDLGSKAWSTPPRAPEPAAAPLASPFAEPPPPPKPAPPSPVPKRAQERPVPPPAPEAGPAVLPGGEHGRLEAFRDGGILHWQADWTLRSEGNAAFYSETGSGDLSGFEQPVRWNTEAALELEGLSPLRVEKYVWDQEGRTLAHVVKTFQPGRVVHESFPPSGTGVVRKTVDAPAPVLVPEALAVSLRRFGFLPPGPPLPVKVLLDGPRLVSAELKVQETEELVTPLGVVRARKIQVLPQLGFSWFKHPLMERTLYWLEEAPPHRLLRYRGPESWASSETVELRPAHAVEDPQVPALLPAPPPEQVIYEWGGSSAAHHMSPAEDIFKRRSPR